MSNIEKFERLIELVEGSTTEKPLYLVAYSDVAEEIFKRWYPGVEILRAPLKMDDNKKLI